MENNSTLMLSIWVKKKGPFLLLKVISLSPARCWPARNEAQTLAGWLKCLHGNEQNVSWAERDRRKIKSTLMEPWIVNGGPAGCHGWCMAVITLHGPTAISIVLDKMGHHEPESGAMKAWSTTDVTLQTQHHVSERPWLHLLTVSQQHI